MLGYVVIASNIYLNSRCYFRVSLLPALVQVEGHLAHVWSIFSLEMHTVLSHLVGNLLHTFRDKFKHLLVVEMACHSIQLFQTKKLCYFLQDREIAISYAQSWLLCIGLHRNHGMVLLKIILNINKLYLQLQIQGTCTSCNTKIK